jgi:hypothetical protein
MPRATSLLENGLHQFSVVMHDEIDPTWDYDMKTWLGVIREEHVNCSEGVFLSDPAIVSSSQVTTDTDVHLKFKIGLPILCVHTGSKDIQHGLLQWIYKHPRPYRKG